jgi:hypothetical protein
MANKYDATVLAANAQQLETLATSARANMLSRTTEKATRLGAEGERLARQAKAADSQRADADALAKSHLAEAERYDAKANSLEQQAAAAESRRDPAGAHDATELREEAAKQRQGAEVARSRSTIASEDAKRLADEAAEMRVREQAVDAELADMGGRLLGAEMAVDNLEWHAEKARAMAATVRQADDLQAQAAAAAARGDNAAATALGQRAAILRDDADVLGFVRAHPPFALDQRTLSDLGVDLAPGALDVPMPELLDPNSPMNPLAANTTSGTESDAIAAADLTADETLGVTLPDADSAAAMLDDPIDAQPDVASSDSVASDASSFSGSTSPDTTFVDMAFVDSASVDAPFPDTTFADGSFTDSPVAPPSFDFPSVGTVFASSDFADPDVPGPDSAFDPSVVDSDAGFADPVA